MTRKTKQAPSRSHEDATIESLRKSPKFAAAYLNDVLADGDERELLVALRRVADAFGGVPKLASKAKLNATTLYRTLSPKGNPELRSMNSMLKAMGLRLAVHPIAKSA
jgi:probable addiction module antidote protein